MADDKSKRGLRNRDVISVKEPDEIRDWCGSLNCTETEFRKP